MVEITPEIQAQLDEAKKSCIFCKILSGEVPGKKVYDDDYVQCFLDINPWVSGHALLIPKEHYPIMPYLPSATFKHMFGLIPELSKAFKKALLVTGFNVVIANGAVAGQQSPHFLVHLLPRENGDGLDLYGFDEKKPVEQDKLKSAVDLLSNNIPIMMRNHFVRNPVVWRKKNFVKNVDVVYEDEKALCSVPLNPMCIGHLVITSKDFDDVDDMDDETCAHLFFIASFCATAVFESLGAHGSNIVLKSGLSNDNKGFSLHVFPRFEEDGLNFVGKPMQKSFDLDSVSSKLKDETFYVQHNVKEKKKLEAYNTKLVQGKDEKDKKGFDEKKPVELEIDGAIKKFVEK